MTGPTNRKNLLTFGDDPVPDTDSGPLFHFSSHCAIGYFRTFISIYHTVTPADFYDTHEVTDAER